MSTRCYIGKENKDGTISYVYCHFDGYINCVGKMLLDNYKDRTKVEELISLGDMSYLEKNINPPEGITHTFEDPYPEVCVFYGRDRGEEGCDCRVDKHIVLTGSWIDYLYVYGLDDVWRYSESDSDSLKLLEVK